MRTLSVFMMSCAVTLALAMPLYNAYAQTREPAEKQMDKRPPSAEAQALAASPAYRLYDQTMAECFAEVKGVNPFVAAKKRDMKALNMDRDDLRALQDCMNDKGVNTNFENYYGGIPKDGQSPAMSAAQQADMMALDEKMKAESTVAPAAPVTPAPVSGQTPAPAAPVSSPVTAPPPAQAAPVTPPEPEEPEDAPAPGGAEKAKPKTNKYWVTPGQ